MVHDNSDQKRLIPSLVLHVVVLTLALVFLFQGRDETVFIPQKMHFQFPYQDQIKSPTLKSSHRPSPLPRRLSGVERLKTLDFEALGPKENWVPLHLQRRDVNPHEVLLEDQNPLLNLVSLELEIPTLDLPTPDGETSEGGSLLFGEEGTSPLDVQPFPYKELELLDNNLQLELRLLISASGLLVQIEKLNSGSLHNDALIQQYFRSLRFPSAERDYVLSAQLSVHKERPR